MNDGLATAETKTILLSTPLSGTTASRNDTFGALQTNSTGSPAALGAFVQAGSGVSSAGSTVKINFGIKFGDIPFAAVTSRAFGSGAWLTARTDSGITVNTATASTTFDWIAAGTI